MAQTAKTGAEQASDTAEVTREATDRVEDVAHRDFQVIQRTANAVGEVHREMAQRSAEHTAELGRVLVDLLQEQTRYNLETLSALTGAVDWDQVAKAFDWDRVRASRASTCAPAWSEGRSWPGVTSRSAKWW